MELLPAMCILHEQPLPLLHPPTNLYHPLHLPYPSLTHFIVHTLHYMGLTSPAIFTALHLLETEYEVPSRSLRLWFRGTLRDPDPA